MTRRVTDFEPRFSFPCESPDDDDQERLTLRTESSERYCFAHFPWDDNGERRRVKAHLQAMGLVVE